MIGARRVAAGTCRGFLIASCEPVRGNCFTGAGLDRTIVVTVAVEMSEVVFLLGEV